MFVFVGMNIRWDYFVNQYDTSRFASGADARDNRHIQFVREFASVVSVLQVRSFFLDTVIPDNNTSAHVGQDEQRDRSL